MAGAEELVAGEAGAAADADFQQRAALGAVVGFDERLAAVSRILAGDAAARVGFELEPFERDWLAAELADDDLVPAVALRLIGIRRHAERLPTAAIAGELVPVGRQHLADDLLRRRGGTAKVPQRAQPADDLGLATELPPTAVLAFELNR